MLTATAAIAVLAAASPRLPAQTPIILRGGWLFTATSDSVVPNRGIFVRGGKLLVVEGDFTGEDTTGARVIQLSDDESILPGLFDPHAHYNMTLGDSGVRQDEYTCNPLIFLANGITSTFPAGELDPEGMEETHKCIDRGEQIGPRIYNSGPYFGTARPGWDPNTSAEQIAREVDTWAERGVGAMQRTTKAFYDAGGLLTLGTDNPSRGEYLAGFSAHRELHALVLAGIPPARRRARSEPR
jgi:hypothetical protein